MENEQTTSNTTLPAAPSPWRKRLAIGGVAIAALTGLGVASALSDSRDGGGWGWGARHHFQEMRGGPMNGMMGERGLERFLDAIGATPEQADKLRTIFGDLRDEVRPAAAELRDSRGDVAQLLGAATIDRAAVEQLRSEKLAAIDQVSQKVTAALVEAAEVLTPEQRAKVLEHFQERGRHHRW